MAFKTFRPFTPGRRYMTVADFSDLTKKKPEKSLIVKGHETGGRNSKGRETCINKGGGHKQRYRLIDFRREKVDIACTVTAIEYDPNRSARIALVVYVDGEKRYIIAPVGVRVGDTLMSGSNAEVKAGNALPLKSIPEGQMIHNIELKRGAGGQIVRSAGGSAQLMAKEGEYVQVRLPSGEVRAVHCECMATIGQVSNPEHQNITIGKAGRSRWLGIRPRNRANAKNPCDHRMGGGEGRTKGGCHPCSRTGVLAKGLKTRRNKRSRRFIVKSRHVKTGM